MREAAVNAALQDGNLKRGFVTSIWPTALQRRLTSEGRRCWSRCGLGRSSRLGRRRLGHSWDRDHSSLVSLFHLRLLSQLKRWEERHAQLHSTDILVRSQVAHLHMAIECIQCWLQDYMAKDDLADPHLAEAGLTVTCQTCGQIFKRQHTLVHLHGIAVLQGPPLDIARDTIDGRPTCRHCGVSFISWQNLRHHTQALTRTSLELTKAPPLVLQQHRRRLLDIYGAGDLQLLQEDGNLSAFLTHRCVLCGFWAARTQQMSAHMSREHPEAANLIHEVLPNITRARVQSPCSSCKKEFRSKAHPVQS